VKIDAHHHFWNLEKVDYPWLSPSAERLYRNFEADELGPIIKKLGIDKTVLVQSMDSYEDTDYMLETAANYNWIGAVVGWVPLDKPDEVARMLEEYKKHQVFKGIRHLIHEEKDPNWIVREEVIEGLKVLASFDLPFDVVATFPNHLKHIPTIAEKVPNLKMVIDHLAKPPIEENQIESWAKEIFIASKYPQVYAKVSGLITIGNGEDWSAEKMKLYLDIAMENFGANRLMFGSDWPILNISGDYNKVWEETNKAIKYLSEEEKAFILGGTASEFYII
jgi:L-fuconolactonase